MTYSFPKLVEILASGEGLVLATVVETEGSTPQVPGASAVFSAKGLEAGTVGGGVLEARTQAIAGVALRDGRCRLVRFRLDADPADKDGAICGGRASILVDPLNRARAEVFGVARDSIRAGKAGALATLTSAVEGDEVEVRREWLPEGTIPQGSSIAAAGLTPEDVRGAISSGQLKLHGSGRSFVLIEPVRPLPRLVIAGAGHVGRALAHFGDLLDFHVTVIDDRAEFASAENIPEADEIIVGDIASSVRAVPDSPDNYFVVVTRGHERDAEALRACLGRPAAYVGMIGSKSKVAAMRREFLEKGWATADEWARIRAPIGLEIGSKTVEEIAVSIAAELVLVRSSIPGKRGQP
jgi:xanthine dehydrogenase accessory factor